MSGQKFLRTERVALAICCLEEWREQKQQASMHLWPLLSLMHAKVGKTAFSPYQHSSESEFWDKFFRLPGDQREEKNSDGKFTEEYYIEPLVLSLKPSDYPHRGPWSIRTRTFVGSWKAAIAEDENKSWKLAPNYADIFVDKVLRRGDEVHMIPVVDLAAFLFRECTFPAEADARWLERKFREEFPFETSDYQKLFKFVEEDTDILFQGERPEPETLHAQIVSVLVQKDPTSPQPPMLLTDEKKSLLESDDALYVRVRELLEANSSGIIFRGCPGTSKTWYAKQIAHKLVKDQSHVFQCQFHPSLGYEDFVEGHVPDETSKSGFKVVDKLFLEACAVAERINSNVVVIVDEINRGDPARVFGELLTYVEHGYRGVPFRKAYSGATAIIPKNLLVFGTMNQHDRSITQFDLALIRRFDHVDLEPSVELVEKFLTNTGKFSTEQIDRVTRWFETLQKMLPFGIGHTYFKDVTRTETLKVVWKHRMLPYCEAVLELEPAKLEDVKRSFDGMLAAITGHGTGE